MPKIVEILGPSGVGKTTLYKSLQSEWKEEASWGVYHDIRYKRNSQINIVYRVFNFLKRKYHTPKQNITYKGINLHDYSKEREFFKKYPEFCNRVVELVNKHSKKSFNGNDKRFINLYFMFETIEHVQAIRDRPADKRVCLMDEGLLSRLMHLNSPSFSKKTVEEYIQFMPLPDAVIYLQCRSKEILKRAQKKEKHSTVHLNLNKQEIKELTNNTISFMNYALQIVKEKGVVIYQVDAEREVDAIKQNVLKILKKESGYD